MRTSGRGLALTSLAVMLLGVARPATGQVQVETGEARSIRGLVTDSAGFPLDAEVYIVSLKRRSTANAEGVFRFGDLKPGRYDVGARRVGFYPQLRRVTVGDTGATVRFSLVPLNFRMPPIVTSAARGGLAGVIGDTAYHTLADAEVTALARAGGRATTDSLGRFFMDLRAGRHMVSVSKPGYATRTLSVTIPKDSGRDIVVQLTPQARRDTRLEFQLKAMRERLMTRSTVYSTFYTRDDIEKLHFKEFSSIVTAGAGQPVDESCWVYIDGGPQKLLLWLLTSAEVDAMEVYVAPRARSTGLASRPMGAPDRRVPIGPAGCPVIYAWLRK